MIPYNFEISTRNSKHPLYDQTFSGCVCHLSVKDNFISHHIGYYCKFLPKFNQSLMKAVQPVFTTDNGFVILHQITPAFLLFAARAF